LGQQGKRKGDGFVKVKRQQKKEEIKLVPPGQNSTAKNRVTFKRDNGLPVFQKKDLDISSEVNRAHFEAKVPYSVRIQGVTKNSRGCLSTIKTLEAMAKKLIRYREIVITAARKVDAGIVDIETNELWERVKMQGVNFDRYLGKKTGGGLEKLRQELQAENEGVVLPLAINWIGGPKDVHEKKVEGKKASTVVFAVKGSTSAKNISVWAEWLRQSGRAPSEPSETPRWQTTPRPAPIRRVALHIALRSRFRRLFSLCRYPIVNEH